MVVSDNFFIDLFGGNGVLNFKEVFNRRLSTVLCK